MKKMVEPQRLLTSSFVQQDLVVLPIEHLTPAGATNEFGCALLDMELASEEWLDLFNRSFDLCWKRLGELHEAAPRDWFPPRLQHVCVVRSNRRVRPYFQPFHQSAWLVEYGDFDPEASNVEFGAYQLLQVARMGVMQQVAPAFLSNLSAWFRRSEDEVSAFADACSRSRRADALAYRATAQMAARIGDFFHQDLRPPAVSAGEPLLAVPGTGLIAAESDYAALQEFARTVEGVVRGVVKDYYARFGGPDENAARGLCEWLVDARPRVWLTGGREAGVLWTPDATASAAEVQNTLGPLSSSAAASIQADLSVISDRSEQFVGSLADTGSDTDGSDALPHPQEDHADQSGLSYMHLEGREIAYNLDEPGMRRRLEPSPPLERLMLAARTVHEWAHLATEAGWVKVPETRSKEFVETEAALAQLFLKVVLAAPADVQALCAASLEEEASGGDVGIGLARFALSRIEDFQSNLLAADYLDPSERDTYVRNNLRSHIGAFAREDRFQQLARYAYEFQYLRFSTVPDPWRFFLGSTWFEEEFLRSGIVSQDRTRELFAGVGRCCDLYEVDRSHFIELKGSGTRTNSLQREPDLQRKPGSWTRSWFVEPLP